MTPDEVAQLLVDNPTPLPVLMLTGQVGLALQVANDGILIDVYGENALAEQVRLPCEAFIQRGRAVLQVALDARVTQSKYHEAFTAMSTLRLVLVTIEDTARKLAGAGEGDGTLASLRAACVGLNNSLLRTIDKLDAAAPSKSGDGS